MTLTDDKIKELDLTANKIRQDIIEMLVAAEAGHSAGPLGMVDIFTALYFHVLKHDPKNPEWEERDRLLLSNGHICPVRYVAMHHAGYDITKEELLTFRKMGSRLEGHPSVKKMPALETSSGPLGEGTSVAAGIALGYKMDQKPNHVWCLVSDAEQQEGMTWEGAMLAGKYKLSNLTVIIDRNNIQIDGVTEDVMPIEPLREKYEAFGWHVIEINGHDMRSIIDAMEESKAIQEKPVFIIANTVAGKGVSFMENDYKWHGIPPDGDQAEEALAELKKQEEELKQ